MPFSQSSLARLYIADAIKNSSTSIKACWTIVFTAATIGALTPVIKVLKCEMHILDIDINVTGPSDACHKFDFNMFVGIMWPFFLYFATFIRFYLGGIRTFDIKYNEIFSLVNNEIVLAERCGDKTRLEKANQRFLRIVKYNDETRHKFEVFWLLLQSLVVVSLAYDISTPEMFVKTFAFLIIANAGYLTFSIFKSNLAITKIEHEVFPQWAPGWAPPDIVAAQPVEQSSLAQVKRLNAENLPHNAATRWACNNLIHGILIMMLILRGHSKDYYLAYLFCTSNVIIDFLLTRNFYFPKFLERYTLVAESEASQNGQF